MGGQDWHHIDEESRLYSIRTVIETLFLTLNVDTGHTAYNETGI